MKIIFYLLFFYGYPILADDLNQIIIGQWAYDGFMYEGHRYPKPDSRLSVEFTFNADHTARLYWARENEKGFCERKGTWALDGEMLKQEVTWLNPENQSNCGQDADMQMGRITLNKISIMQSELNIFMDLNGKEFIYIAKRKTK